MTSGSRTFGPEVDVSRAAFIHPTALVYGRVTAGEGSSLWPYAVIRAEGHEVRIGAFTNIQDHAVVHVGARNPTIIGNHVSVAHRAVVHGSTIGDDTLVGIGATIMDAAVIGRRCIVAGHAIVTEGMEVPDGSIVAGVPAKVIARRDSFRATRLNALLYHRNALAYARGDHRAWDGPEADEWRRQTEARILEEPLLDLSRR